MIVVYLDQSDWSYLHQGRFPAAERVLQREGESGSVIYMVSVHHLEETAGLADPCPRLEYIRSFPGTALVPEVLGFDIVERDAAMMVGAEFDPHPSLGLIPLVDYPFEKLVEFTKGFERSRRYRAMLEPLYKFNRDLHLLDVDAWARDGARKPTKQENEDLWRAHFRGDVTKAIEIIERVLGHAIEPAALDLLREKIARCHETWCRGATLGLVPPIEADFDEVFASSIFRYLPLDQRRDPNFINDAGKAWRRIRKEPRPATCFALVETSVKTNMMRHYSASEQVDALHAAFAPLVHVFTCDKRVESILTRIGVAHCIRSGRLDDVATQVADLKSNTGLRNAGEDPRHPTNR